MRHEIAAALLLVAVLPLQAALAQPADAPDPIVQMTIDPPRVVVGQPATIEIVVLAPNYMTAPPELPDFQVRNAATRPLQSTNISENRNGTAYAGVRFQFAIYPQEAGSYAIADQSISVTYAAVPPTTRRVSIVLPRVALDAYVPDGAASLRPFLSAAKLTAEQTIDRSSDQLKPGDAVKRTVTIHAEGTLAMLLPPQSFAAVDGLKAYPAQPVLDDKTEGRSDVMTSTRVDSATYMLERAGDYLLPAIDIGWWNVGSGKIEEVRLDAVPLKGIATPAAADALDRSGRGWTWDGIVAFVLDNWPAALLLTAVVAGLACFAPRLTRRVAAGLDRRRQAHLHSEAFAFSRLRRALRHRDARVSYFALIEWLPHFGGTNAPTTTGAFKAAARDPELDRQLDAIERELFAEPREPTHWSPRRLLRHVTAARRRLRAPDRTRARAGLPAHLNPDVSSSIADYRKPAR